MNAALAPDRFWFDQRRVCVVGLGKSGLAAASLLKAWGAAVQLSEKKSRAASRDWAARVPRGVSVEWGGHHSLHKNWDLVVVSPGVPTPVWEPLLARGVPVWGELELAFRILKLVGRWPETCAAVTGTNGKTTTTALIGAIFRAAGRPTVVAGNIGAPLSGCVDRVTPQTALALEISSYQLERAPAFAPGAGAVLNITPDHLGRHHTMENYAAAKFNLFANQSLRETAVLNAEDAWCRKLSKGVRGRVVWFGLKPQKKPGAYWVGGRLLSTVGGRHESWTPPTFLPGKHNIQNALAAVALAQSVGISHAAIARALATFRGVAHRIEFVREWRGIRFVNDSKATNVDSTLVALEAVPSGVHLILGGEHKGSPYTPLAPLIRKKVRQLLLIGEAAPLIEKDLGKYAPTMRCGTLAAAVARAAKDARTGDTVLLSPACASFDQFRNFEHRGQIFKDLVNDL